MGDFASKGVSPYAEDPDSLRIEITKMNVHAPLSGGLELLGTGR